MNKWEKEVIQTQLDSEKAVMQALKEHYQTALNGVNERIASLMGRNDANLPNVIRQSNYQNYLARQLETALSRLQNNEYQTLNEYINSCYTNGYVGTMYNISGQGMPVITPIDPKAVVKAIETDSKINEGLYKALGIDVGTLKKSITDEVTRGIASGNSYAQIARSVADRSGASYSNSLRIARTEGHRVQQAAADDARHEAKKAGADVIKQWDASLDGSTRELHRILDGQIVEIDEDFEALGYRAQYPGGFGDPSEDCNCRCVARTRVRSWLDESDLKTMQERAEYYGLDKTKDFDDFKTKYLNAK